MGRRHELTDEPWARLGPLMPEQGPGGQWNDHRTTSSASSGCSTAARSGPT